MYEEIIVIQKLFFIKVVIRIALFWNAYEYAVLGPKGQRLIKKTYRN